MDPAQKPQRHVLFCAATVFYLLYALVLFAEIALAVFASEEHTAIVGDVRALLSVAVASVIFAEVCFVRKRTALHLVAAFLFAVAMMAIPFSYKAIHPEDYTTITLFISDILFAVAAALTAILTGVSYFSHGRIKLFGRIWFVPGIFGTIAAVLHICVNLQLRRALVLVATACLAWAAPDTFAFLLESFDFLLLVPAIFLSCKWLSSLLVNVPERKTAEDASKAESALEGRKESGIPQDAPAAPYEELPPSGEQTPDGRE